MKQNKWNNSSSELQQSSDHASIQLDDSLNFNPFANCRLENCLWVEWIVTMLLLFPECL